MQRKELKEKALNILHEYFTYTEFTKEQEQCIVDTMSGKDVVAILPTGAGKSLCFQIPALYFKGITIVITPLVSLMHDQVEQLSKDDSAKNNTGGLKKSIPAEYIDSTRKGKKNILLAGASKDSSYKILYLSPERLQNPAFIRFAKKVSIDFIAIDEAHCISMWGYDFRPDYLKIIKFINGLDKRPVIGVYSATATPAVIDDTVRLLKLGSNRKKYSFVQGNIERKNLSFSVRRVYDKGEKRKFLMEYLYNNKIKSGIIYCSTKDETHELYDYLIDNGFNTAIYHSIDEKFDSKQAERNQKLFMSGKCRIMVATNAFGMGINKRDVRFVIHYNMPKDLESYYQEAGRAGRDGEESECIILYYRNGKKDDYSICEGFLERFRNESKADKEITEHRYQMGKYRLIMMEQYCEMSAGSSDELQEFIVDYFKSGLPKEFSHEYYSSKEQKLVHEQINQITELYYNNTKIANEIRKGEYVIGEEKETECSLSRPAKDGDKVNNHKRNNKMPVSYVIENESGERITYFDMMVADAVYTLEVNSEKVIYPKRIYELLSGDSNVTLKPDKKAAIESSLDKMIRTTIKIDKSKCLGAGKTYEDEKKIKIYHGKFLPLTKRDNKGYYFEDISPLYRFASAFNANAQFLTFPEKLLCVSDEENVKMQASVENIKIIYYLLYRIMTMSSLKRGPKAVIQNNRNGLNRTILFKTLENITGINMLQDRNSKKRKEKQLFGTGYFEKSKKPGLIPDKFISVKRGRIDEILDSFKRLGLISGYEKHGDTDNFVFGKETEAVSVTIDFM